MFINPTRQRNLLSNSGTDGLCKHDLSQLVLGFFGGDHSSSSGEGSDVDHENFVLLEDGYLGTTSLTVCFNSLEKRNYNTSTGIPQIETVLVTLSMITTNVHLDNYLECCTHQQSSEQMECDL